MHGLPTFSDFLNHIELVTVIYGSARAIAKMNDPGRNRMMKPLIPDQ